MSNVLPFPAADGPFAPLLDILQRLRSKRYATKDLWVRVFEPDVFARLAAEADADPSQHRAICALLAQHARSTGPLQRYQATLARYQRDAAQDQRTLASVLGEHLPVEFLTVHLQSTLRVPRGYLLSMDGIWKRSPQGIQEEVGGAPVLLTARTVDAQTGESEREVVWWGPDGWRSRLLPRTTLTSARRLARTLGALDAPVSEGNAAALVRYLAAWEAENASRLPVVHRVGQAGWQGDGSFLLPRAQYAGRADARLDYVLDGGKHAQLLAALRPTGSWEGWLKAIAPAAPYPSFWIALYASLASVLLAPLDAPPFVVSFTGPSLRGKTTLLRGAASVWGAAGDVRPSLLLGWDEVRDALPAARVLNHLPLLLDDARSAEPGVVLRTMSDYALGRHRGGTWRGVLLSSGRERVSRRREEVELAGRVIALHGSPFGTDAKAGGAAAEAVEAGLRAHHGHLGPRFLSYLGHPTVRMREEYDRLCAHYASQSFAAIQRRYARNVAALTLAADYAHRATVGLPRPPAAVAPLDALKAALDPFTIGTEAATRPLLALVRWMRENRHRFVGERRPFPTGEGWCGCWGSRREYASIRTDDLSRVLKKAKLDPVEAVLEWRLLQWSPEFNSTYPNVVGEMIDLQREVVEWAEKRLMEEEK